MRLLLTVLLAILVAGCEDRLPDYPARSMPPELVGSAAAERAGAQLFAEKCAACHGHSGEGRSIRADFFQPPAPLFSEQRYVAVPVGYLYWRIEHGKHLEPFRSRGSVMPAWGPHLSETEIWQLVAHLKKRANGQVH